MRPLVAKFAELMEQALLENEHKGGWEDESREFLTDRLQYNLGILSLSDNPEHIARRAVNVANFAMMLAHNLGDLRVEPKDGTCCDCGANDNKDGNCPCRPDKLHCEHWWEGDDEC